MKSIVAGERQTAIMANDLRFGLLNASEVSDVGDRKQAVCFLHVRSQTGVSFPFFLWTRPVILVQIGEILRPETAVVNALRNDLFLVIEIDVLILPLRSPRCLLIGWTVIGLVGSRLLLPWERGTVIPLTVVLRTVILRTILWLGLGVLLRYLSVALRNLVGW